MAHKFNVGDRVKLREGLVDDEIYHSNSGEQLSFKRLMRFENSLKIETVDAGGDYHLDADYPANCFFYSDEMLEAADPEPTEFHVGDVVAPRDNLTVSELWTAPYTLKLLLRLVDHTRYEAIRLTVSRAFLGTSTPMIEIAGEDGGFDCKYFRLVRRAPQPKEMTMAELEKALGYPVKIVKEAETHEV